MVHEDEGPLEDKIKQQKRLSGKHPFGSFRFSAFLSSECDINGRRHACRDRCSDRKRICFEAFGTHERLLDYRWMECGGVGRGELSFVLDLSKGAPLVGESQTSGN